jgi:signal peptidase II
VPTGPAVRAWRAPVAIAIAVIVVDQLTKHWAVTSLGPDREIDLFWTLRLNLAFNNGMAFGQAQGFGPVIAIVATLVIVYLLVSLRTEASPMSTIGMGLLIGGAAGNLIDRVFRGDEGVLRGAVVDFIDFQWFPIFNVADMAVNVGAALLILSSILGVRRSRHDAADGHEAGDGNDAGDDLRERTEGGVG